MYVYSDSNFSNLITSVNAGDLDYSNVQNKNVNFHFPLPVTIPAGRTYFFQIVENVASISATASISSSYFGFQGTMLSAGLPTPAPTSTTQLSISSISPNSGVPGTHVTLTGSFAGAQTVQLVSPNGSALGSAGFELSSDGTQILFGMPAVYTGTVGVVVAKRVSYTDVVKSNSVSFTIIKHDIQQRQ